MSKRWTTKEESILTQVFTKTDIVPQQQRHDVDLDADKGKSLREKARKAALRLQNRSLAAIERKWRSMNPTTIGLGPQHKRPSSKPSGTSGTSKTAILKTLMKLMKQKDYTGSDLTRLGHALQQVVKKGGLETIHQQPSLTPRAASPVRGRPVNPFHASLMKQLTGSGKTPSMAPTPKNPLFASLMKELAGKKTKQYSAQEGGNKTKKPTKQLVGLKQKIQQMMVKRKGGIKTIDEMMEEKRRTEKAEKQSRLNPFTRELLKKRQQMRLKD